MIVVCLEGCHGSGKSSLCGQFERNGFNVLDEAFFEMPRTALHPQSLTMETLWVAHWIQRLLRKQSELPVGPAGKKTIFIADRSPYSALFYAKRNGMLLDPLITEMIEELREHDIHIFTVVVQVEPDVLWQRIQQRLAREPERARYNEADRKWMEKTIDFYESRAWDFRLPNNDDKHIREVMSDLLKKLSDNLTHLPHFHFMRNGNNNNTAASSENDGENNVVKA